VVESLARAEQMLLPDDLHLLLDPEVNHQGDKFRLQCLSVKS
jgi:hypothetical protein